MEILNLFKKQPQVFGANIDVGRAHLLMTERQSREDGRAFTDEHRQRG